MDNSEQGGIQTVRAYAPIELPSNLIVGNLNLEYEVRVIVSGFGSSTLVGCFVVILTVNIKNIIKFECLNKKNKII